MRYKVSNNIKAASSLLLKLIINANGGFTEVGLKNNLSRQLIHRFTLFGRVPLSQVYSVAKTLKVSVWSLSYIKLMEVFGEQTPSFEVIVKDVKCLSPEDKDKILKLYRRK